MTVEEDLIVFKSSTRRSFMNLIEFYTREIKQITELKLTLVS